MFVLCFGIFKAVNYRRRVDLPRVAHAISSLVHEVRLQASTTAGRMPLFPRSPAEYVALVEDYLQRHASRHALYGHPPSFPPPSLFPSSFASASIGPSPTPVSQPAFLLALRRLAGPDLAGNSTSSASPFDLFLQLDKAYHERFISERDSG
jgi:hypothetical protein